MSYLRGCFSKELLSRIAKLSLIVFYRQHLQFISNCHYLVPLWRSTMSIDYSHVPATTPPPGVTANFEHPDSIAYQVVAISLPFTCTATFIVLLRLYTRFVVVRSPGLDDCGFLIFIMNIWRLTQGNIVFITIGLVKRPKNIRLWASIDIYLIACILGILQSGNSKYVQHRFHWRKH